MAMCQDFVEAVAEGRPTRLDGQVGLEVPRVIYAACLSTEQGWRVML